MSNVVTVFNKTVQVKRAFLESAKTAVREACSDTEAEAKQQLILKKAVDTGNLLNSVQAQPLKQTATSVSGEVKVGAEYGVFIEYGHHTRNGSFVPGRPYITPAFEKVAPTFEKKCEQELGALLK